MDISRAFGAPFRDPRWAAKAAWAGLWTALLVTVPAVSGYHLDYIRNVAHGQDQPLPEWKGQLGRYWVRGFLLFLGIGIYVLPAVLIVLIGLIPALGSLGVTPGSGSAAGAVARSRQAPSS